jgi:hypothetical protein
LTTSVAALSAPPSHDWREPTCVIMSLRGHSGDLEGGQSAWDIGDVELAVVLLDRGGGQEQGEFQLV